MPPRATGEPGKEKEKKRVDTGPDSGKGMPAEGKSFGDF